MHKQLTNKETTQKTDMTNRKTKICTVCFLKKIE